MRVTAVAAVACIFNPCLSAEIADTGTTKVSDSAGCLLTAFDISPNRDLLILSASNHLLRMRPDDAKRLELQTEDFVTWAAAFTPDGRSILAGGRRIDGKTGATIYDAETGKIADRLSFNAQQGHIQALSYSPDGKLLAIGFLKPKADEGKRVRIEIRDTTKGTTRFECDGHESDPNTGQIGAHDIRFSPTNWLVSVGTDDKVRIWNKSTGALIRTCRGHRGAIACVDLIDEGRQLVTGGSTDGSVRAWDPANGSERWQFRSENEGPVCASGTSHQKQSLVAVSGTGKEIVILTASTGELIRKIDVDGAFVTVRFSPDGQFLFAVSQSSTMACELRWWRVDKLLSRP